ncbi:MAG: formylglycine-generating enzyme family protein [Bacillota bacterium]
MKKKRITILVLSLILLLGLVGCSDNLSAPSNSNFVNVPAGTTSSDNGSILLDYHIEMSKYEVTHAQFIEFLNSISSGAGGYEKLIAMDDSDCLIEVDPDGSFYFAGFLVSKDTPVIEVTWYGAVAYANWLSRQEGLNPAYDLYNWELKDDPQNLEGYRLPTTNEWEYAARGGSNGDSTTYSGSDDVDDVAWYHNNSNNIYPVGDKQANELGIYDMSGNVYEWTNTHDGSDRVLRGGSWINLDDYCEVDYGYDDNPSSNGNGIGFRLTKTKLDKTK